MKNRMLTNIIKISAGIGIVVTAYALGAGLIPITFELPTSGETAAAAEETVRTPTVEVKLVETHTVEYVEERVIETEYVDVVKEVPVELRNFSTLEELEGWVNDSFDSTVIRFRGENVIIDCDDYALEMQQKALHDGYILSFQIITGEDYNELFAVPLPEGQVLHAIDLAIIGNSVFYIEPQTGEIVHAAYLD